MGSSGNSQPKVTPEQGRHVSHPVSVAELLTWLRVQRLMEMLASVLYNDPEGRKTGCDWWALLDFCWDRLPSVTLQTWTSCLLPTMAMCVTDVQQFASNDGVGKMISMFKVFVAGIQIFCCVCACSQGCGCIYTHAYMSTCFKVPILISSVFLHASPPYTLRQGLSLNLGLAVTACLTRPLTLELA